MKKVISKKHKVVNAVSDNHFDYLMKTGEYDEYKPEPEKRKRRTKAEIEADKAKSE